MSLAEYKVLFIVDHKHRDLPSLSLIGYYLKKKGCSVEFVALWQEKEKLASFKPDAVVLPKPIYDSNRLIQFKRSGIKIIVINTEGNPQDKKFKLKIDVQPDLFFYWNKSQQYLDRNELDNDTIAKLVGCPRIDFYHKDLSELLPNKNEILENYSLPINNKTITIATSTQDADFDDDTIKRMSIIRKRILAETADYKDIVSNMKTLRSLTTRLIEKILDEMPSVNVIVKPHPNENIFYWKKLVESYPASKNIKLCVGEPIINLLRASDLHISLNVCTTTFESLLSGIPVIELHTELSEQLYEAEHLYLAPYTARKEKEALIAVKEILSNANYEQSQEQKEKLTKYIEKYFYKFDGKRCYEYAKEIVSFLSNIKTEKLSLTKMLLKSPKIYKDYIIFCIKGYIKRIIVPFLNFFKTQSLKKREIDSRGRFDNRIQPGDEILWFRKFESNEKTMSTIRINL